MSRLRHVKKSNYIAENSDTSKECHLQGVTKSLSRFLLLEDLDSIKIHYKYVSTYLNSDFYST